MIKKPAKRKLFLKISNIIIVICLVVFAYSLYSLANIFFKYRTINNLNEELVTTYTRVINNRLNIDWENLLKRNSDVIAWIYIPNTNINFPVLQGEDNEFYLYHNFDRNYSVAGSIFMEETNDPLFTDFNTIIYGHNMRNNSMFGDINRIVHGRLNDSSSNIYLYLPNETLNIYQMVSFNKTTTNHPVYQSKIRSFEEFLDIIKIEQERQKPIPEENLERTLTLSTCGDGGVNTLTRSIIFAKLVETLKLY